MPVGQQQPKERVFGTNGETVEENAEVIEPVTEEPEVADPEEYQDPDPDRVSEAAAPVEPAAKYRIGDKTFATQAEALAYAESQVSRNSEADAYRQVLREVVAPALQQRPPAGQVTPPEEDATELYTDPDGYLRKRDERIKSEVFQQLQQTQATRDADERTWREFSDRHPDLTEFRSEITELAMRLQPEVQGVATSKGPQAAYDYVATKFKAQVERQAQVLQPRRVLKAGGAPPAGGKVESVTPKPAEKKPLSFTEQLRSIRRRGAKQA